MADPSLQHLLDTAVAAAGLAGKHTLKFFNAGTAVEFKADQSPVTQADREAELIVRDHLLAAFPTHSVLGEEHGTVEGDPDYQWVIDPIDGTKSFIHGVPLYSTLVGLQIKGKPAVGVIYLPATDDIVFAATGMGAFHNDAPTKVSTVDDISDALICTSGLVPALKRPALIELARRCRISRTWGDGYGYYLVATGRAEIMVDPKMNPWDCAAIIPVIQEAGGWCSAWSGHITINGGDLFASNGKLAGQVRHILER
ncbi:MAG: putative histidinol-phosphate phosphatase [Phycisphaerales bacterium]|nr:putative histidinol-phosphate phosphatase [Phycisphaerales bacterium]